MRTSAPSTAAAADFTNRISVTASPCVARPRAARQAILRPGPRSLCGSERGPEGRGGGGQLDRRTGSASDGGMFLDKLFEEPALYLAIVGIVIVSIVLHELGHAL